MKKEFNLSEKIGELDILENDINKIEKILKEFIKILKAKLSRKFKDKWVVDEIIDKLVGELK